MKRCVTNPQNKKLPTLWCKRAVVRKRKGTFLVEGTIALFLLVAISVVLLQNSVTIRKPRARAIVHNMADAYLSYELAFANREDFADLSASGTWPLYPNYAQTQVNIGTMPEPNKARTGDVVTAQVRRTRMAYDWTPAATGAIDFADLGIQVWKLQSHLVYSVDGQEYVKSRTVIRSQ